MLSNTKALLSKHFSQHITLYFIVILCFSVGIACGAFSVKALSQIQKEQLVDYLVSTFKAILSGGQINYTQIFWYSILNSLKTILIIWIFSVLIITFPLVFFVIGIRGFILGFTVGFLVENLGYKGILFSTVSILPQNLIIIPLLIIFSVVSISYSILAIKNRKQRRYGKNEKFKLFLSYTVMSIILFALLSVGSLIEGYVSPSFLKGVSGYLMK